MITETHINTNNKETRKEYTYYFSGGDTKQHHFAGVAIIVKNKLINYMEDIQPINERLMTITLNLAIPVTVIAVYAHTAMEDYEIKKKLYDEIKAEFTKHKSKHITHIVGDFNARIQTKLSEEETCIGQHTFNKHNITIETQGDKIDESRNLLIDLCQSTQSTLMNTQFQKTDDKLATHRMPTYQTTPFERPHYEMIDYWITANRWKNTISNIETEPKANITTDHLPMKASMKIKLKNLTKEKGKEDENTKYAIESNKNNITTQLAHKWATMRETAQSRLNNKLRAQRLAQYQQKQQQ